MSISGVVLRTGAAQSLLQLIGFAGGLFIVRLLPVGEYATYTMLTAGLGTLTALADAGITSSVMAQAGRVHPNRSRIGRVLLTGLVFRRRLSVVVACLASPPLVWLLCTHGERLGAAMASMVVVLVAFASAATTSILEVPLKLDQSLMALQRLNLQVSAVRVAITSLSVWLAPVALVALVAVAIVQWWGNLRLRRLLRLFNLRGSTVDPNVASQLHRAAGRTLPGAVYYCLAAQLNVWLLAALGTTASVAQIGALSRLAMIFSVVSAVVSLIAMPRFARLPADWPRLAYFYAKVGIALIAFGAALVVVISTMPGRVLWLLGGQYESLENEVVILALSGALSLLATMFVGMNGSRGYFPPGYVHPLLGISHTVPLLLLIDVSTVHGVLLMQCILSAFSAFYGALTFVYYARQPHVPLPQSA
jgi:O-antigen/teichoic acid export membrane protein